MNKRAILAFTTLTLAAVGCGDDTAGTEGTGGSTTGMMGGGGTGPTSGGAGGTGGTGGSASQGGMGGAPQTYTVGGTVTGLMGSLTLANGTDTVMLDADGDFTFAVEVADGASFTVSVDAEPTFQRCTVIDGSGTVSGGNVTNVSVSCDERYVFFMANDGTNGIEPWYSDGTTAGTNMLDDVNPGGDFLITPVARMGDAVYFMGTSDFTTAELYRNDGTTSTMLGSWTMNEPKELVVVGDTLFFQASGVDGAELYKSDGTPGGTVMVADINGSGDSNPNRLAAGNGLLFFSADDGIDGREPWISDGTELGTQKLANIHPTGDGSPSNFTAVGAQIFFSADDENTQNIFVTDGTPGNVTNLLMFASGIVGNQDFAVVGNELIFVASNPETAPYKSDGTPLGTDSIRDLMQAGDLGDLYAAGGKAYFQCAFDAVDDWDLCVTDGTFDGTIRVEQLNPTGLSFFASSELTAVGSRIFFGVNDGTNGAEPWVSDGTPAGTFMISDVDPAGDGFREPLGAVGNNLLFAGHTASVGEELWRTDGTLAGTVLVKDICPAIDCGGLDL